MIQKFAYRSKFLIEFGYNVAMSMKEQVKYDLDILKGFLFACIGAIFGIISYAVMNIDNLSRKQIILGGVLTLILVIALIAIFKGLAINRKKLRELE